MKSLYYGILLLYTSILSASDNNLIINNSEELNNWCRNESSQYFLTQDITPYNWSSSRINEGNFIKVKGRWLIKREYIEVKCSIRAGVSERYASITINKNSTKPHSSQHSKKIITISNH